jgi:hypothetical protein
MADEQEKKQSYSFEEYRKKFFPVEAARQELRDETPEELGARLARESVEKVYREVLARDRT